MSSDSEAASVSDTVSPAEVIPHPSIASSAEIVSCSLKECMELTPVEFRYLQGLHDVCCVVQEVARRMSQRPSFGRVVLLCRRIVAYRIFPQHSSLSLLIAAYQTLNQTSLLLCRFQPAFLADLVASRHEPLLPSAGWNGDGSELHGILPWMITLFAHSVQNFSTIVAMWSVGLLASVWSSLLEMIVCYFMRFLRMQLQFEHFRFSDSVCIPAPISILLAGSYIDDRRSSLFQVRNRDAFFVRCHCNARYTKFV
eukprot:Gregarina_sp_Poly_1__10030@NODE_672_length_6835_cov_143_220597_g507_i0_p3_GENE_NODE_672_length_6835_cov_143_220597_g507_i0NODE_672_length_6835_cov_143_220597_g507_i0_p3_ORF_typecomplete_len254_score31_52RabGAPTBC/PF00566_18/0_02_NODE_672_length_6835_cov_143_220597_g507_i018382599